MISDNVSDVRERIKGAAESETPWKSAPEASSLKMGINSETKSSIQPISRVSDPMKVDGAKKTAWFGISAARTKGKRNKRGIEKRRVGARTFTQHLSNNVILYKLGFVIRSVILDFGAANLAEEGARRGAPRAFTATSCILT